MTAHHEPAQPYHEEVFLGAHTSVARVQVQVARMAPHFRVALLLGERGCGKRTVAHAMHRLSPAASLRFSVLDAGAFASGTALPPGTGTLYLRGVDKLPANLQHPLTTRLRALPRELRLLAGSIVDPRGMVAAGRLCTEMHDALATLEIRLVPLRERTVDLELVAAAMLARCAPHACFTAEAIEHIGRHPWPGNLAELWHALDALRGHIGEVCPQHLQLHPAEPAPPAAMRLDEVLQRHVYDVLERCAGNKLRAAELLGISRSTLYRMLETQPTRGIPA